MENKFDFRLNIDYIQIMNEKLKELREKRGLSQAEVALEIGVSRQMYNKYERGDTEPSLSSIKALCKLYAVSYEELLDSSEKEKSSLTYKINESYGSQMVASPGEKYGISSSAFGTENYFVQIMNLLPHLLLSEKSRLLTAVSQSITEDVEAQNKTRKSQAMKVNQKDVYFPTDEEYRDGMKKFFNYAKSKHFTSNGEKWTREDMHER